MLGQRAGRVPVVVDALRLAAAADPGDDRVRRRARATSRAAGPSAGVAPAADDRRVPVALVAHDARARGIEQARDLRGDLLEHAPGAASVATRVAIRRSAACSSARARAPPRWRRGAARPRATGDVAERRDDALGPAVGIEDGRRADQTHAWVPSGRLIRTMSGGCEWRWPALRRPAGGRRRRSDHRRPAHDPGRRGPAAAQPIAGEADDLLRRRIAVGDDAPRVADDEALRHASAPPTAVAPRWRAAPRRPSCARPSPRPARAHVSAAVARNSWLDSRLSVIDSRTNGPALCAVFRR